MNLSFLSCAARRWAGAIAAIGVIAVAASASGQIAPAAVPTPARTSEVAIALEQRFRDFMMILRGDHHRLVPELFSDAFLALQPLDQFGEDLRAIEKSAGSFKLLGHRETDPFTIAAWIRTTNDRRDWSLTVTIQKERPYAIDATSMKLIAERVAQGFEAWAMLDADLDRLIDRSAFALYEILPDGAMHPVHRARHDRRMAVGVAAQMWLLAGVGEMVKAGDVDWEQLFPVHDEFESLPGLGLALAPLGVEFPLKEFTERMFKNQDTTGTDHMLELVGRDRLAAIIAEDRTQVDGPGSVLGAPADPSDPFLSTLELYKLTCAQDARVIARYAKATAKERQRMVDEELPTMQAVMEVFEAWKRPQEVERVGWFATPEELCRAMARIWKLAQDPALRDNLLGPLRAAETLPVDWDLWKYVGVAHGGLPGVFSGTWLYERKDGRVFVMSFIFNNPNDILDEQHIGPIISASEALVGRMDPPRPKP